MAWRTGGADPAYTQVLVSAESEEGPIRGAGSWRCRISAQIGLGLIGNLGPHWGHGRKQRPSVLRGASLSDSRAPKLRRLRERRDNKGEPDDAFANNRRVQRRCWLRAPARIAGSTEAGSGLKRPGPVDGYDPGPKPGPHGCFRPQDCDDLTFSISQASKGRRQPPLCQIWLTLFFL